jgi:hypothetical protein
LQVPSSFGAWPRAPRAESVLAVPFVDEHPKARMVVVAKANAPEVKSRKVERMHD